MRILTEKGMAELRESIVAEQEDEIVDGMTDRLQEVVYSLVDADIDQWAEAITVNINALLQQRGYVPIGGTSVTEGLPASTTSTREDTIKRCRVNFFTYPLGYNPIEMTSEWTLGEGGIPRPDIQEPPHAKDDMSASLEEQQEYLDSVWEEQINMKTFTSHESQLSISNKLQYDGEVYVQIAANGNVQLKDAITDIPALRILDTFDVYDPVICLPTDAAVEMGYWVKVPKAQYNLKSAGHVATVNTEDKLFPSIYLPQRMGLVKSDDRAFVRELISQAVPGCWVYHGMIGSDPTEHRGWPYTSRVTPWVEHHTTAAKDAMQLLRALTTIAWQKKIVDGTKAQVQRSQAIVAKVVNNLQQRALSGSTYVSNDKIDMQPVNVPTGGVDISKIMMHQTALMVGAGTQWPNHYLTGDVSQGTLATARSAELPVIKHIRTYQGQLGGLYRGVFQFILWMKYREKAGEVTIKFPPVVEPDIRERGELILKAAMPNLAAGQEPVLPIDDDEETGEIGATTMLRNLLDSGV